MPIFALRLRASSIEIGAVSTFPSLLNIYGQLLWGSIGTLARNRKSLMLLGGLIYASFYLLIAHAATPQELILLLTIQSFFFSAFVTYYLELLSLNLPRYKRGSALGKLNVAASLGSFFGNLAGGWILHEYGFIPAIFYFSTFFTILGLMFLSKTEYYTTSPKRMKMFKEALKNKRLTYFLFVMCCFDFVSSLPGPFFSIYLVTNLNGTLFDLALLGIIGIVVGGLFYDSWGWVVDFLGRRATMIGTLVPITLTPLVYFLAGDVVPIYLYTFISSLSWAGFNLATSAYLFDIVRRDLSLVEIALFNTLTGTASSIAPLIGGAIVENFGIRAAFLLSFLLRLLVILPFLRLRETKGPIKEKILRGSGEETKEILRNTYLIYSSLLTRMGSRGSRLRRRLKVTRVFS